MIRNQIHRYLPIGLVFSLGVGLSIFASVFVAQWEAVISQNRFQRQIETLTVALQRSLNRYTDVLLSIGDYYGAVQTQVEPKEFAAFVERSLSYSGIQALEWTARVRNAERAVFEQRMRSLGYPNFQITEQSETGRLIRAGDRPEYFPVTYVEPLTDNETAVGFDLASNVTRRLAMGSARDSGQITATGRIRLVQEKRNQFGFLVFLPIYQGSALPRSQPIHRKQLTGFLLGVFRVSDVVEESLQGLSYDVDFALYDQNADLSQQFLGFYQAGSRTVIAKDEFVVTQLRQRLLCPTQDICSRTLTVGGREWIVRFVPATTYLNNPLYGAMATLTIGLLLTSSLILFLLTLKRELEKTKELSELKLRFFSMASHELRTPLSTILLSSQFLRASGHNLSEEQKREHLQRVQLSAKRMVQLIADILTLSRAEVGKLEFTPELFNIGQLCKQIVDEMQMGATQNIIFTSDVQSNMAYLDQRLLRSLLTNLLSNAIKYSSSDSSIVFKLFCNSERAIFQICDQGIGIPIEEQRQLCKAFYRGKNARYIAGTGLGLAVVKACVDLHQGQISIESDTDKGTKVTVELPF